MKRSQLEDGGCKFAVYLTDGVPSDDQVDRLFEIDGVEEVSSTHFQWYKVIFHLENITDLTPERVERARQDILSVLGGAAKGPR